MIPSVIAEIDWHYMQQYGTILLDSLVAGQAELTMSGQNQ